MRERITMKYPKYLYRRDDGERFTHRGKFKDLKTAIYTMDNSMMSPPYEYPYELLIRNGFKIRLKDCVIIEYKTKNDGHGDEDDEC